MSQTSDPTGQRKPDASIKFNDTNKFKLGAGFHQDKENKKLRLMVSPEGTTRSWFFYGQAPSLGKAIKKKIGDAELMSAKAARAEVVRMDAEYSDTKNPKPSTTGALTLGAMVTSKGTDSLRRTFDRHFSDWENLPLDRLTAEMVQKRQAEILQLAKLRSRHGCVNPGVQAVSVAAKCLRTAFNHAFKQGRYLGANMGKVMDTAPVVVRTERLGPKRAAYEAVLADEGNGIPQWARVFFKLLPEMGPRWGHFIQAKWSDIDLGARVYVIPATIAKNRKVNKVPLSLHAVAILKTWREESTGAFVFPSENDATKPRNNPTHWWDKIKELAGLQGSRMHDLRREFGFTLRNMGVAIEDICKMMNHSNVNITAKIYALPTEEHLLNVLDGARLMA